jgi:predicted transcriptional regulator
VDAWLIPIQPKYSAALFGFPQELELFARPDELGISVEQVYYRGGRSGETAPARVLWYVSGPSQGLVMGRSELIEVVDAPWDVAYRRFRRLGVYTRADVQRTSDSRGLVRALRVINTEAFDRPLPLSRLQRFAADVGHGLQLQSPSRIGPDLFERIMKEVAQ